MAAVQGSASDAKGQIYDEVESRYMKTQLYTTDEIWSKFPRTIPDGSIHVLVAASKVEFKRPAEDERVSDALKRVGIMESKLAAIGAILPIIVPKTLSDFKNLYVSEKEFQLDDLSATQPGDSPIIETPGLHEFWKGFGEFPSHYFVRTEVEVVFWRVIKNWCLLGVAL